MQTATRPLTSLWTTVRTQLRDSRDARAARASLERELAGYNSQSDLDDLHAILDRHSDQETKQIRRILAYQSSR
jgi:phosphatidate phosphatase APP1